LRIGLPAAYHNAYHLALLQGGASLNGAGGKRRAAPDMDGGGGGNGGSKLRRGDESEEEGVSRCTDLICLGLSWDTTEEDLQVGG
jgi:hypothetical protein